MPTKKHSGTVNYRKNRFFFIIDDLKMHYYLRVIILLIQPRKHIQLIKNIRIKATELMVLNIFISHSDTATFITVHAIFTSYLTNGTLVSILFEAAPRI